VEGATSNLANLLFASGDRDELRALLEDSDLRPHVSRRILRVQALWDHDIAGYLRQAFTVSGTPAGLLAASLVLLGWFFYLRKLDVFEPEPWLGAVVAVVGGAVFSLFTTELYDLLDFGLGFRLRGNDANDLLFCVFGIGLIEEALKAVPVLLLMRWTRFVNESVDYLVYGSLFRSRLRIHGELLYFQDTGLHAITGRAFSAAVLHMILTSLVMYGVLYSKHHRGRGSWAALAFTFASACVVHGLYDFFLVSEGFFSNLAVVSTYLLIIAVAKYATALRCALNISEMNTEPGRRVIDGAVHLCFWMTGMFVVQYLLIAWKYGVQLAERNLLLSSTGSIFLVWWLFFLLGTLHLRRNEWVDALVLPAWVLPSKQVPTGAEEMRSAPELRRDQGGTAAAAPWGSPAHLELDAVAGPGRGPGGAEKEEGEDQPASPCGAFPRRAGGPKRHVVFFYHICDSISDIVVGSARARGDNMRHVLRIALGVLVGCAGVLALLLPVGGGRPGASTGEEELGGSAAGVAHGQHHWNVPGPQCVSPVASHIRHWLRGMEIVCIGHSLGQLRQVSDPSHTPLPQVVQLSSTTPLQSSSSPLQISTLVAEVSLHRGVCPQWKVPSAHRSPSGPSQGEPSGTASLQIGTLTRRRAASEEIGIPGAELAVGIGEQVLVGEGQEGEPQGCVQPHVQAVAIGGVREHVVRSAGPPCSGWWPGKRHRTPCGPGAPGRSPAGTWRGHRSPDRRARIPWARTGWG
jgi:RsiW-degrading membrane proteinase PrsW (M82 family)